MFLSRKLNDALASLPSTHVSNLWLELMWVKW